MVSFNLQEPFGVRTVISFAISQPNKQTGETCGSQSPGPSTWHTCESHLIHLNFLTLILSTVSLSCFAQGFSGVIPFTSLVLWSLENYCCSPWNLSCLVYLEPQQMFNGIGISDLPRHIWFTLEIIKTFLESKCFINLRKQSELRTFFKNWVQEDVQTFSLGRSHFSSKQDPVQRNNSLLAFVRLNFLLSKTLCLQLCMHSLGSHPL